MTTPTSEVAGTVLYLAIYFAQRHEVELLILVLMSNHHHIVFDDPYGRYPDFLRDFHAWVAIALNIHHTGSCRGKLWDYEKPSTQRLLSLQACLDKLLYAAVNPVAAGIEPVATRWPGYLFGPDRAGTVLHVRRPRALTAFPGFPAEVVYRVPVPQAYGDMAPAEVRRHFRRARQRREHKLLKERNGKPFLGRKAALLLGPDEVSKRPLTTHSDLKPKFSGEKPAIRRATSRRRKFLKRYRECREQLKKGDKDIAWPPGTFAMVARFGAEREPSPDRSYSRRHHRGPPTST